MKHTYALLLLVVTSLGLQATILYRLTHRSPLGANAALAVVRDAGEDVLIDISELPSKGTGDIVLVEFGDFECPFCRRHANGVAKELEIDFIERGLVRYVFAHNPLSIHTNARYLASVAICAGKQGLYWEVHSALFTSMPTTRESVGGLLKEVNVDQDNLAACLRDDTEPERRINQDIALAQQLQLTGTPGFALGHLTSEGMVRVDVLIMGAQPYATFKTAIDEIL